MNNLIIDSRIRKAEYEYLTKYFNVIKLPLSNDVYNEISGHSDIFYCKIHNKIISAPNAKIKNEAFIIGNKQVENKYPQDVAYNVCQIGNSLIINNYVDNKIIEQWNKQGSIIRVNQGYTKCSISVTGNNSCITSDKGIEKTLKSKGLETVYIETNNIHLLDKQGKYSNMKGFIGGATFTFDNKLIVFGDINKLEENNKIKEFVNKQNLELINFKGLDIIDYGGAIEF